MLFKTRKDADMFVDNFQIQNNSKFSIFKTGYKPEDDEKGSNKFLVISSSFKYLILRYTLSNRKKVF